jgi:hypothetical protein
MCHFPPRCFPLPNTKARASRIGASGDVSARCLCVCVCDALCCQNRRFPESCSCYQARDVCSELSRFFFFDLLKSEKSLCKSNISRKPCYRVF